MVIRRIVTGVCALCFAIPAVAGAAPATDPPTAKGPYGVTIATGQQDTVKAKGPYGVTTNQGSQDTLKAKGPYGITTNRGSQDTVKARGPYGVTTATASKGTTGPRAYAVGAARSDDTNGWRTAAISEAALLAALALGFGLLLPARRSAPRLGT